MARPRKPTKNLKLHGTYRSDRHGDRAAEPRPTGDPHKPDWLTGAASEHWDHVAPQLIDTGVATWIDQPALVLMCQFWAKAQSYMKSGEGDYKIDQSAVMAAKQWRDLASRFGLTPVDRTHLQVGKPEDFDPAAEFIA